MGFKAKARVSRNRDMISELPDAVLSHMLSFLETKYAVRTSVLSTRWKNIWALVPIVNFEFNYSVPRRSKSEHARFLSFVDHVLHHRDSSNIQRFRLHCYFYDGEFSRIVGWIRTAIRCNVVELDLYLSFVSGQGELFKLPKRVFRCKTLVTLKLNSSCLRYAPPKSGCFPNLKSLYVQFREPYNDSMEKLFSCCPLVEDLTIKSGATSCYSPCNFKLSFPILKRLTIDLFYLDGFEYLNEHYFFINAPKLESFEVDVNMMPSFSFENSTSPDKALVIIRCHEGPQRDDFCDRATTLLAAISNVEDLSLSAHLLYARYLPAFDNLIRLKLVLHNCYRWKWLAQLLKRSPNLKCLILEYEPPDNDEDCIISEHEENLDEEKSEEEETSKDEGNSEDEANVEDGVNSEDETNSGHEDSENEESAPTCLLSHLKTVSVSGFSGCEDVRELVKYLLKNGGVLKKMTICMGRFMQSKVEFYKEIAFFQRASRRCRVEFV